MGQLILWLSGSSIVDGGHWPKIGLYRTKGDLRPHTVGEPFDAEHRRRLL